MTPPPTRHSRLGAFFDVIWRHHIAVLLGMLLVSGLAGWAAAHLELRTDFAELLPSGDPAVAELRRTASRIGGTEVLQVVVEGPEREANLRLSRMIAERIAKLPPRLVRSVSFDVQQEREFFRRRRWLYLDLPTLTALRDALQSRIERSKNPLLVDLDDSAEKPEAVMERIKERAKQFDPFPTGYFEGQGGKIMVIMVRPPAGLFGEHVGEALFREVRRIVEELRPASFHPQIQVSYTGPIKTALDERDALENDLVLASIICLALVCGVVILYYGRLRAVILVGTPALVGVVVAFGFAALLFGYLNSSTAFLGSIVLGNGINFAIIQLARYEEERRAGHKPREAAQIALSATLRPTVVAALGATMAYASLCVTRFRGFSQFGVIGGIGMVAAWLATVILLPPLYRVFDHRAQATRRFPSPSGAGFADLISRLATRWPRQMLVGSLLCTALAFVPFFSYVKDPFEYDFSRLRNRRSFESGIAALNARINDVFGRPPSPAVIIAERRAQTEEIRRKILERDKALAGPPPSRTLISEVRTLDDFLPGSLALQREKLAVLGDIRHLLDDPGLRLLEDDDRRKLAELRPPEDLAAVEERELPPSVLDTFTETDGTRGRIVLVYHGTHVSVWDGRNLMRIADIIGAIPLDDGTLVRTSGHAVVFAAMIRSIAHDAPIATAVSLLGVTVLVLALARSRRGAVLVIGTLCVGVAWMLGAAAWAKVRTNFLNFIALPITFGIGVDYGINIYMRYVLEGRGRVGRAVRSTGGAVALCSLTTIIGYGALLVADNQGLVSFGAMAVLGEVACLTAAILVMPALLVWMERRWKSFEP